MERGLNSTVKSTQYGCLQISIFEHATPLFGQDAPPGSMTMTKILKDAFLRHTAFNVTVSCPQSRNIIILVFSCYTAERNVTPTCKFIHVTTFFVMFFFHESSLVKCHYKQWVLLKLLVFVVLYVVNNKKPETKDLQYKSPMF